ncbi:MAG: hypothetical protein ABIR57_07125 [Aeromicrobium sp.]
MTWFALGSPAQATSAPAPVFASPATSDFTIHVTSEQPIHFAGTVAGPTTAFDKVFVTNFTANPGDPPIICQDDVIDPGGVWSCDTTTPIALGDWELHSNWFALDPGFGPEPPTQAVLQMHVVPEAAPPPPPPPPTTHPPSTPATTQAPAFVPPLPPLPLPTTEPTAEVPPVEPPLVAAPPALIPGLPDLSTPESDLPGPWDPSDHPREVLTLGVATFAILAMVGPTGLAASSTAALALVATAGAAASAAAAGGSRKSGSVKAAKVKMNKFSGPGAGRGDQSRTWQLPGWEKLDAWSLAVPLWLAPRSPLTARILVDGSYLRAIFSTAWTLLVIAGGYLGLVAAHQTNGVPIAPSVALTATLLVIAIFDATAGAAGVLGFLVGMFIWHSNELSAATTIRSFLGLAALWFAIPLIASATRPFRRTTVVGSRYAWDRLADTVIGTLTAGWAVQKTIGGMPGLSGLDLSIAHHADKIALIAMIAVVSRVVVEEFGAWRYPLRLQAVEMGKMPFAGAGQRLFATGLRTVLFVFLSIAFIGNCWQLWVGAVLFLVPQILSVYERKFPNSERLHGILPAGILKTLLMLIIGSFFAKLVFSILTNPDSMLRNGFILMTIPGLVMSALGLFGHDGPEPKWTWPRQFIGVLILSAILGLIFTGW